MSPHLWKKVRSKAKREGKTFSRVIEEAVRKDTDGVSANKLTADEDRG